MNPYPLFLLNHFTVPFDKAASDITLNLRSFYPRERNAWKNIDRKAIVVNHLLIFLGGFRLRFEFSLYMGFGQRLAGFFKVGMIEEDA